MDYEKLHTAFKVNVLHGRYVNLGMITSILQSWNQSNNLQVLGSSVQGRPVYGYKIGRGKTKILMWSQMHGNESTTTKGLMDFMNFVQSGSPIANELLSNYCFCFVPMLNPDGSEVYTRVNVNQVDLNRDFQDLSQPESRLLMDCYNSFKPDYCYNLHDQRTIFAAGLSGKPATISFLAPSYNEEKEYDSARLKSVAQIMTMVNVLEEYIPGQIGRFNDDFNINCVGDTFQNLKTPTILLEAGHFQEDYDRETTRKYVFIAILSGLYPKSENLVVKDFLLDYLHIPQNNPNNFDIIYRNVRIHYDKSVLITNFAVQYKEELINNQIFFNAFIVKIGELDNYCGYFEYDAKEAIYSNGTDNVPKLHEKANFYLGKNIKIVNGLIKKQ